MFPSAEKYYYLLTTATREIALREMEIKQEADQGAVSRSAKC